MKNHFFVKLVPSRPTFHLDITQEEAALMQAHGVFWSGLMNQGIVHVFGPVMDPDGVYGMGIMNAESVEEARALLAGDPAASLMTVGISPMQAVLPS